MIVERGHVQFGGQSIDFAVVRRKRATLEIAVEPDGTVVVAAPISAPLAVITEKVQKRASWVCQQQRFFRQFVPRTPPRRYVPGETHLYLGRQYRLKVIPSETPEVKLWRGFLSVRTVSPRCTDVTRDLVNAWFHNRARIKLPERVEFNLDRFANRKRLRPNRLIIRKLRLRWGSMSPAGSMVLNERLVQAPVDCIDYVITHELCHMVEPHHGPAFFRLLTRVLPDWHRRKQRLETIMS